MESFGLKNYKRISNVLIVAATLLLAILALIKHADFLQIIWEFCRRNFHWQIIYSYHFWILAPFILAFLISGLLLIVQIVISTARHWAVIFWIKNNTVPLPSFLRRTSKELNLGGRLILVSAREPLVFTVGLLRSRICLSSGLARLLSAQELKAVLWHEIRHIKSRDPLKIWLLNLIKKSLWFVPLTKDLEKNYALDREIKADMLARQKMGTVKPLLTALFKVLERQQSACWQLDFSAQAHFALTADRLTFWSGVSLSGQENFKSKNIAISLISLALLLGVYLLPSCRAYLAPMIGSCQEVKTQAQNFTSAER